MSLLGSWIFFGLIYQGHLMDPPNPLLRIELTFKSETQNELFYYREDQSGLCRRVANYEVVNQKLIQTVISVDPDNADFCGSDTDMQIGNQSQVPISVHPEELQLTLPLGEEELIYRFRGPSL